MRFSWDEEKNRINKQKHGLSFETAKSVFSDPLHISKQVRFVNGESRWQILGMINGIAILIVAHTIGDDGHIRLISARKATKQERVIYEKANFGRNG
ncbi:MAG: BrnT family toxin [Methylomonas sp.]|jgi:uncharacterized DUF497 family protein